MNENDIIINLKHPRYTRKGKCNQCGWCCLQEDCEHLEIKNGLAICLIHDDSGRPDKCKLWPEMPPIPHEGCGYYFIDLWENNKKVKRKL